MKFVPGELLLEGVAEARCRAVVALPARNEEASLAGTLDALAGQVDLCGAPLARETFEILLLLNNCTDGSAAVARAWQREHPEVALHCCERELAAGEAHIGTARRLLMDTAWSRLQGARERCAILSTDADSYVAKDWIAQNLLAMERGADAVGGVIELICNDFESLSHAVRTAYAADRRYQYLVAEMEDLLDPQAGDAWPRHLEHFGASLGCTPEIYARAGGMPALAEMEDVAFVDRLRRVDARLRHEPAVVVSTSARLDGRVTRGLSGQLRCWQRMHEEGEAHQVATAAWLEHRFRSLRRLRRYFATGEVTDVNMWPETRRREIRSARRQSGGVGEFLRRIDCDGLIAETFAGLREDAIEAVNAEIAGWVAAERAARRGKGSGATDGSVLGASFEEVEAVLVAAGSVEGGPLGAAKPGFVDLVAGKRVVGNDGGVVDQHKLAARGLARGKQTGGSGEVLALPVVADL